MVDQDKFIMVGMDDPNLKKISEVLSNKTAKKIIDYLSENKEASEKDLSDSLNVPLNTVEYNIKKLLEVGILKKHKNFFWSKRGKKIIMYELSNKSIVISPSGSNVSEKLKSLVPSFLVVGALSFVTYVYEKIKSSKVGDSGNYLSEGVGILDSSQEAMFDQVPKAAIDTVSNNSTQVLNSPLWMWFLFGGLIALGVVALVNWKRL